MTCGNGIISTEVSEQVAPGRVEYVKLYFDENGRISKEDARWRMRLSEGLAPIRMKKQANMAMSVRTAHG